MKSAKVFVTASMILATLLAACAPTAKPAAAPEPAKAEQAAAPAEATATTAPAEKPTAVVLEPTATIAPLDASAAEVCKDSTYIVAAAADPAGIDASISSSGETWGAAQEVYDTLTTFEGITGKVVPFLAESWESKDSKVWDFKIRQGVKFHDGTELDAEAVKFNFDRWGIKDNAYRFPGQVFENYEQSLGAGSSTPIDSTAVVDKYTFRITLKAPSAILPLQLALKSAGIASPTALKEQKEKFASPAGTAVGTGRFKFVSWTPDDKIVYERFDDWWGCKANLPYTQCPLIKTYIIRVIKDANVQQAEFEAGRVDAPNLTAEQIKALPDDDPTYMKVAGIPMGIGYIRFNQAIKPWDKLEVRQAVAHGVNWDAIVKAFYTPLDLRAAGFQPPAIPGYNADIKPYDFDPVKAKELLVKAGYPNGFETDFWYIPVVRTYMPDAKALAEAIGADLANIGIKVSLRTEDWAVYLNDRSNGKFGIWQGGWGSDNGDPDNFIGYHFLAQEPGKARAEDGYYNAKLQELLVAGAQASDTDKRIKIYQEAEQILHDDYAVIPVAWPVGTGIVPRFLKGYRVLMFRDGLEFICPANRAH